MKYNVLVVGLGALGKRHLSSILISELPLNVYCYDINPDALSGIAWEDQYQNKNLIIISSFDALPETIDFALFAMISKGRRDMFDKLVEKTEVKNILYEKVLFQRVEDYTHVGRVMEQRGIRAWVNCARRQMDCYQWLKNELANCKNMRISVSGSEWGLACNGIHFLDIIEFLSGAKDTNVTSVELLPVIRESKRAGFKEVYGRVSGYSGRCSSFTIECLKDSAVPLVITISSDTGYYIVFESNQRLFRITLMQAERIEEMPFRFPYQSEMTHLVLEDILRSGTSRLTTFKDSARLHLQFICPLIDFFEKNGMEEGICPIT